MFSGPSSKASSPPKPPSAHSTASHIKVGFNVTPPSARHRSLLVPASNPLHQPAFFESTRYVGLDFFRDVFRRRSNQPDSRRPRSPPSSTSSKRTARRPGSTAAGIASHTRYPHHRARLAHCSQPLTCAAGRNASKPSSAAIHAIAGRLNIDRYDLIDLRDVIPASPSAESHLCNFFGITTADYQPKPAYSVIRTLIRESRHTLIALPKSRTTR